MTRPTVTTTLLTGTPPRLRRKIGRIGLVFISMGSIIGSGWLFGPMTAAQVAGPAAIFSWMLGAILVLAIAFCYAEIGTMFPLSGGVVRLQYISFGRTAGFFTGWITWIAGVAVAPIEVVGALQYATIFADFTEVVTTDTGTIHVLTPLGTVTAVILLAVFVVINAFGIKWLTRINNALVWWKLGVIALVVVVFLLTDFQGGNFTAHGFAPSGWHGVFTAVATSGIVFSYLGFRGGIDLAGETSNPRRNIPIAVVGSVFIAAAIYIALQIAFIGAVSPDAIAGGWENTSFANDFGPLAAIATTLGLTWLAVTLYIDAVVSPADTGLVYMTITSRVSYGMARDGNAPASLAKTNRFGVPLTSLFLTFAVGIILILPFPSWQQLVGFITAATMLSLSPGPLLVSALRRQQPDRERPYRLRGANLVSYLGFFAANLIVFWTGWETNSRLFLAVLVGVALYGIQLLVQSRRGGFSTRSLQLKAASWLVPWLAGLALISFLGNFGGGLNVLPEWSSIPVIAIFSAAVFFVAIKVALPKADVDENILRVQGETALEQDEVDAAPAK